MKFLEEIRGTFGKKHTRTYEVAFEEIFRKTLKMENISTNFQKSHLENFHKHSKTGETSEGILTGTYGGTSRRNTRNTS